MDMDDIHERYPGNSYDNKYSDRNREKPSMMDPIVSRKDVTSSEDKGIFGKILSRLSVDSDVYMDKYVIPGIWEFTKEAIESEIIYKGYRPRHKDYDYDGDDDYYDYARREPSSKFTYGNKRRDDDDDYYARKRKKKKPDPCDIIIRGPGAEDNARRIVKKLRKRCAKRGAVTVADLYSLIGVRGDSTDYEWGWFDEDNICMRRVPRGYLIVVPEPEVIYDN